MPSCMVGCFFMRLFAVRIFSKYSNELCFHRAGFRAGARGLLEFLGGGFGLDVRLEDRDDGIVFGHDVGGIGYVAGDKLGCGLVGCYGVFTPLFTTPATDIFQSGT